MRLSGSFIAGSHFCWNLLNLKWITLSMFEGNVGIGKIKNFRNLLYKRFHTSGYLVDSPLKFKAGGWFSNLNTVFQAFSKPKSKMPEFEVPSHPFRCQFPLIHIFLSCICKQYVKIALWKKFLTKRVRKKIMVMAIMANKFIYFTEHHQKQVSMLILL